MKRVGALLLLLILSVPFSCTPSDGKENKKEWPYRSLFFLLGAGLGVLAYRWCTKSSCHRVPEKRDIDKMHQGNPHTRMPVRSDSALGESHGQEPQEHSEYYQAALEVADIVGDSCEQVVNRMEKKNQVDDTVRGRQVLENLKKHDSLRNFRNKSKIDLKTVALRTALNLYDPETLNEPNNAQRLDFLISTETHVQNDPEFKALLEQLEVLREVSYESQERIFKKLEKKAAHYEGVELQPSFTENESGNLENKAEAL
jgi:hypothetical protein